MFPQKACYQILFFFLFCFLFLLSFCLPFQNSMSVFAFCPSTLVWNILGGSLCFSFSCLFLSYCLLVSLNQTFLTSPFWNPSCFHFCFFVCCFCFCFDGVCFCLYVSMLVLFLVFCCFIFVLLLSCFLFCFQSMRNIVFLAILVFLLSWCWSKGSLFFLFVLCLCSCFLLLLCCLFAV